MLKACIVQWLTTNLDRFCCSQNEVHSRWLVGGIRPAVNGTSLNAGIAFLHVDDNIVVETTSGR